MQARASSIPASGSASFINRREEGCVRASARDAATGTLIFRKQLLASITVFLLFHPLIPIAPPFAVERRPAAGEIAFHVGVDRDRQWAPRP